MATAIAPTAGQNDQRALRLVVLGSSLRSEAAALVEDINEYYGLVHDVLKDAMREPAGAPIDIDAIRLKLHQRARRLQS